MSQNEVLLLAEKSGAEDWLVPANGQEMILSEIAGANETSKKLG